MPLPLITPEISNAIDNALQQNGIMPVQQEASAALTEAGADVRRLSAELANLVFGAKDATKLKAVLSAFAMHGVNINPEANNTKTIHINFNVVGDNTNLNNLFAPERK